MQWLPYHYKYQSRWWKKLKGERSGEETMDKRVSGEKKKRA